MCIRRLSIGYQLLGVYAVRREGLVPYFQKANELMSMFTILEVRHVIQNQNEKADALASLAASMALNPCQTMDIHVEKRRVLPILAKEEEVQISSSMTINRCEIEMWGWRTPFPDYLLHGYFTNISKKKRKRFYRKV